MHGLSPDYFLFQGYGWHPGHNYPFIINVILIQINIPSHVFTISYLVGGLELFSIFPYIGNNNQS